MPVGLRYHDFPFGAIEGRPAARPRGDKGGVPPVTVCGGRPRGPRQGVFAAGPDAPPAFPLGVRCGFSRAAFLAPGAPLGHGAKG